MLETFLANKIITNNTCISKQNYTTWQWCKYFIYKTIQFIIIILAMFLSWNSNINSNILGRLVKCVLAGLFSGSYILWYLIYFVIIKGELKNYICE